MGGGQQVLLIMAIMAMVMDTANAQKKPPSTGIQSLFQEEQNEQQLALTADIGSEFIKENYPSRGCNFKFHVNNDTESLDWALQMMSKLQEPATEGGPVRAMNIYTINPQLQYTAEFLDLFLRWETRCVVNVLLMASFNGTKRQFGSTGQMEVVATFFLKLSSRDRSSAILAVARGTEDEKAYLRSRFRNFKSVCLLATGEPRRDQTIECFQDVKEGDVKGRNKKLSTVPETPEINLKEAATRLSGRHIAAYCPAFLPFGSWNYSVDGKLEAEGVHYKMLAALAKAFNFTFTMQPPPGGIWGGLVKNDTAFEGMLGGVIATDGDVALGTFLHLKARETGIAFALYTRGCSTFLVPPSNRLSNWQSVRKTFDDFGWAIYWGCIVTITLAYMLTRGIEWHSGKFDSHSGLRTSERMLWPDIVAQALSNLMRKTDYKDEPVVFKVMIHTWIMVGFAFAGIFFKTMLVQKLTALEYEHPVNNLAELIARKIPVQPSDLLSYMSSVYPQYPLATLADQSIPRGYLPGVEKVVRDKNVAMMSVDLDAYYLQSAEYWDPIHQKPLFHVARSCYLPTNIGWVVPKHAFYNDLVRAGLGRLNEAGFLRKWEVDLAEVKRHDVLFRTMELVKLHAGEENRVLGVDHLHWAFVILTYGFTAAAIAFVLEWGYFRLRLGEWLMNKLRILRSGMIAFGHHHQTEEMEEETNI